MYRIKIFKSKTKNIIVFFINCLQIVSFRSFYYIEVKIKNYSISKIMIERIKLSQLYALRISY